MQIQKISEILAGSYKKELEKKTNKIIITVCIVIAILVILILAFGFERYELNGVFIERNIFRNRVNAIIKTHIGNDWYEYDIFFERGDNEQNMIHLNNEYNIKGNPEEITVRYMDNKLEKYVEDTFKYAKQQNYVIKLRGKLCAISY